MEMPGGILTTIIITIRLSHCTFAAAEAGARPRRAAPCRYRLMALKCMAGGLSELPEELDELTRVAHTLPQYMGLEGRVVLQFRNACTSTSTLMDRPVVGVPAYADALQVGELTSYHAAARVAAGGQAF